MAQRKRRTRRKGKTKKQKEVIWKLELAATVLLVCACLCISFLGGRYRIPTWQQVYGWFGVSNATPAPEDPDAAKDAASQALAELRNGAQEALAGLQAGVSGALSGLQNAVSGAASGGVPGGSSSAAVPPGTDNDTTAQPAAGETQVHFIDVGQGDAVLIANGGEYALIDCGTEECEVQLLAYLEQLGVTRLKLLVMTHPHADHIGSMDAVLKNLAVDTLLLPDLDKAVEYPTSACFERVLTAAEANGCAVREAADGGWYSVGAGTLTVLSTGVETDNYNNISLCLRYTAGGFAFVDTGDAEITVEDKLRASGQPLQAALFKAAHHGSGTSNSLALLAAIDPDVVVVSCGLDNSYGHPHEQPMDNYVSVGADVYRTDEQGSVVVAYSAADGLRVSTGK